MALLLLMWAVAGCGRMWPGNFSGSSSSVQPTPSGPTATLSVVAGEFIAGTSEQATLNVTLLDASGNPMAGITPTLDISGVGNVQSCGSTSPIGSTSCTITSTTVGIKAVTVTTPQVNSNTVNVTGLPGETFRYVWNAQTDATLPLVSGRPYNFTVYWGDGTSSEITSAVDSDRTHTYASAGLKTITLSGTYDQFQFATHPERVMDVTRWGTTVWYSMSAMFKNAVNLNSFTATDTPDTSAVTQFSEVFMGAILFNGDVTEWNTNSATHMQRMFKGAVAFNRDISELPGGIWNVSGVLDFSEMFSASISDFTVLNTPVYTPMVFNQNISAWGMNSAINTEKMFAGCESFNQNLNGWFTGNITDMSFMFMHAKAFNSDMSAWDVSRVISFEGMFQGATDFNGNISTWNTASATTFRRMFAQASVFNQDIRNWSTGSVQSLYETFYGAAQFDQQIGIWDTSSNRSLYRTFANATAFARSLNNWNTSAVTSMAGTFLGATNFNNGGDPFNWNTSNVTTTSNMFGGAIVFNQPMVAVGGVWNFASTTSMEEMFQNASAFNQDLSSWNTSNVNNMIRMFNGAIAFNQNLSPWHVSEVLSMAGMFQDASTFNQGQSSCGVPDLGVRDLIWNTQKLTNLSRMFEGAICFNQRLPFNTSTVTNMTFMFYNATAFDHDIAMWDVSAVTDARAFHGGTNAPGWVNTERPFFQPGAGSRRLFLTSTIRNGNLGGVAGADAVCAIDSNKPMTGNYRALLVALGQRSVQLPGGPLNWPLMPFMQYTRSDGTLIGVTGATAVFPPIGFTNPITPVANSFWTGMDVAYSKIENCSDWTEGGVGGGGTLSGESAITSVPETCDQFKSLLCVEE